MIQEAREYIKQCGKMNLAMVLINLIVFMVLEVQGSTENTYFMVEHGAMFAPLVTEGREYYRLFSSMFLHFGMQHLFHNMLLLFFAGDILEKRIGKIRYLLIYLGGGLVGNLLSMGLDMAGNEYHVSAGASGAVFAVIGAIVMLAVRDRKELGERYVKKLAAVAVLTLADGFTQSGIDNMAHLGGMLGGALICFLTVVIAGSRMKKKDDFH